MGFFEELDKIAPPAPTAGGSFFDQLNAIAPPPQEEPLPTGAGFVVKEGLRGLLPETKETGISVAKGALPGGMAAGALVHFLGEEVIPTARRAAGDLVTLPERLIRGVADAPAEHGMTWTERTLRWMTDAEDRPEELREHKGNVLSVLGKVAYDHWRNEADKLEVVQPTERFTENPELLKDVGWWRNSVTQAGTSMLTAVVAGGGTPFGAALAGSAMEAGPLYEELREAGDEDAAMKAVAFGTAVAVLEKVGFDQIFKGAKPGVIRKTVKHIVSAMTESGTEWAEEPVAALIKNLGVEGMTPTKYGNEVLKAMAEGVEVIPATFVVGGGASVVTTVGEATRAKQALARGETPQMAQESLARAEAATPAPAPEEAVAAEILTPEATQEAAQVQQYVQDAVEGKAVPDLTPEMAAQIEQKPFVAEEMPLRFEGAQPAEWYFAQFIGQEEAAVAAEAKAREYQAIVDKEMAEGNYEKVGDRVSQIGIFNEGAKIARKEGLTQDVLAAKEEASEEVSDVEGLDRPLQREEEAVAEEAEGRGTTAEPGEQVVPGEAPAPAAREVTPYRAHEDVAQTEPRTDLKPSEKAQLTKAKNLVAANQEVADYVRELPREHRQDLLDEGHRRWGKTFHKVVKAMGHIEALGQKAPAAGEKAQVPTKKPGTAAVAPPAAEAQPVSVAEAINKGETIRGPKGATQVRVTTAEGGTAVAFLKKGQTPNIKELAGAGPFTKVEFGVVGKKGFAAVEGEGRVVVKKQEPQLKEEAEDIAKEAQEQSDKESKAGYADTSILSDTSLLRRVAENIYGFFRAFGRARVSDKPLARKLDKVYAALSTAHERAIIEVHKALKKTGQRTLAGSLEVVFALEEGARSDVTADLLPLYDAVDNLRKEIAATEKAAGVLKLEFPESARKAAQDEITKIEQKEDRTKGDEKRLANLQEELEQLEKFTGFMPHSIVARKVLEMVYEENQRRGRMALGKRLELFHKQRKGRATLREYVQGFTKPDGTKVAPILAAEDIDVGRLAMRMAIASKKRLIAKDLIDYGVTEGYIKTAERKDVDRDQFVEWGSLDPRAKVRFAVPTPPPGSRVWVHRLYADGLELLSGVNDKGSTAGPLLRFYDKILGMSKTGQFFNPKLIWAYNEMQRIYGGAYEVNPVKNLQNFRTAMVEVLTQGDRYMAALEGGAFQEPVLSTRATEEQMVDVMARRTRSDIGKTRTEAQLRRIAEGLVGEELTSKRWQEKGLNAMMDSLMATYRAIATVTWTGDRVQRMHTYLNLIGQGMTPEAAAVEAGNIHGAYSKIAGTPYKRIASRVLFVQSFRLLMPLRTLKAYADPVRLAGEAITGKPVSRARAIRAAKALVGTVALPTIIHNMLLHWGWEPTEEEEKLFFSKAPFRIKLGDYTIVTALPNWKYKKEFVNDKGEKREVVIGINNIVNMMSKWITRLSPKPQELDQASASILSLIKWEVNPVFRVVSDLWDNEASFGEAPPRGSDGTDWVSGAGYAFRNIFRLYGSIYDRGKHATGDLGAYKKQQFEEMNQALSLTEKIIAGDGKGGGTFGYGYTRGQTKKRVKWMARELRAQVGQAKHLAEKTLGTPEEIREEKRKLDALYERRIEEMSRTYHISVGILKAKK